MVLFGRLYIRWLPAIPLAPLEVTYRGKTSLRRLTGWGENFDLTAGDYPGFLFESIPRNQDLLVITQGNFKAAHIRRVSSANLPSMEEDSYKNAPRRPSSEQAK